MLTNPSLLSPESRSPERADRAVFDIHVRSLLEAYEDTIAFYSPDVCFEDARKYIPGLTARRKFDPAASHLVLDQIGRIIQPVERTLYEEFEEPARARISSRDSEDWPIVAATMLPDCPVWTEDRDFFGSGVATWTNNNVELYLQA
jgi:predicted nucleic acid-binding protein